MKAKKVIAVLMTAAMTVGMLAGCGGSEQPAGTKTNESAAENTGAEGAATETAEDLAEHRLHF